MEQKILILLRWQNQREEEEDEEVLDLESRAPISFLPSVLALALLSAPFPRDSNESTLGVKEVGNTFSGERFMQ